VWDASPLRGSRTTALTLAIKFKIMNRLIEIGFQCVGHWKLDNGRPVCELTSQMKTPNILYAFVSNGEIKYIGKTAQPLKGRMASYQNPGPTQSTNIKNNANIKTLLESDEAVDIFVLPDNGLLHYGGFHINLAAGLEDSLISDISPPWNGKFREKTSARPSNLESVLETPSSKSDEAPGQSIETNSKNTTFQFQVRTTYFNQGFFNVPVKYMQAFGSDRDRIEIYCGERQVLVQGYINRSVNVNGTPRIMGGSQLRQWFHENVEIDNPVNVEVISPMSIWLQRVGG